jgi:hypothetical protein
MPEEIHPLSTGARVVTRGGGILVEPFNVSNIFYGVDSISDMQLLIAQAEGHLPSPEGISVLSAVGYFPGNMTLFREIRKIPFRANYDLATRQLTAPQPIPYRGPNDEPISARLLVKYSERSWERESTSSSIILLRDSRESHGSL